MGLGFKRFFQKKKDEVADSTAITPKSASELKALILRTGAVIEVEDDKQYVVGFQGGKFLLSYKPANDILDIIYPNFEQFDHKYIGWANMVANQINAYYGGWNCYFRIAKDGEEENPVSMSLSYRLWLTGSDGQIAQLLRDVMSDCFNVSREFTDGLKKAMRDHVDLEKLYTVHDFNNKIAFIQNQTRMGHDGQLRSEQEWESDNKIPLSSLLDVCEVEDLGLIQELRIISGEEIEKRTDQEAITSFDICDFIRANYAEKDVQSVFLSVRYEFGGIDVVLNQTNGCTEKTLFYQAQYLKHTKAYVEDFAQHSVSQASVLMEVRLTTEKEDYWEAKYMIDEARSHQETDEENLSSEDRAIISFVDLDLSSDFYWGRKFFNDACYFQALRYFMKIYQGLKSVWVDLSEEQRDSYYDVCFFIGFIFMNLKMYDKAFYYLKAASVSRSISSCQELINCLCNMNAPQAIPTIQGYLKTVREIQEEEKEDIDESVLDFYQFLLRRLAYMFINQRAYEEAEDLLNRMIKNGNSVEFAQAELDYIKQIRAQEELKNKLDEEKKGKDVAD